VNAALYAVIASATLAPAIALSATVCERYQEDLRALAGEGEVTLAPLMSRPSGALDKNPPKEIGCQAHVVQSDRSVLLGFARPEYGADNAARATRINYVNAGLKPAPTPEPSLGSEGFSLLTTIASERKPNYLVVVGHKGALGVQLTVQKGNRSQSDLTDAEIKRGRAIVKRALDDLQ
jgi:hypothetical protein